MKHGGPAYLEWWRAYLVLSHGCSQLMLKSMQQVLDASVAPLVYRPSLPVMPVRLPALAGTAWVWPMNMAAYHSSRLPLLAGASLLRLPGSVDVGFTAAFDATSLSESAGDRAIHVRSRLPRHAAGAAGREPDGCGGALHAGLFRPWP